MEDTRAMSRGSTKAWGPDSAGYAAARGAVAAGMRTDLATLRLWGRDPVRMLNGLVTNDLAGLSPHRAVYAAMLTPKGRVITDLRVIAPEGASDLLVLVPRLALDAVLEHLRKYVPPMFARFETARMAVLGVYGPRSAELLEALAGAAIRGDEDEVATIVVGDVRALAVATHYAGDRGFDLITEESLAPVLEARLLEGAVRLGGGRIDEPALEILRIEAGRPRVGAEITEETLPAEVYETTGAMARAVSFTKGCYTGQEVVVRIAHRGHVNRHLRGLLLGDQPPPPARAPLHRPDGDREVGWITAAVRSPHAGETIALAILRREVEPGANLRVGTPTGPPARVVDLPFTFPPPDPGQ